MTYAPNTPNEAFAWPLEGETYRYFTNVEKARSSTTTFAGKWGEQVLSVDNAYEATVTERRRIFARDPKRASALPHMRAAEWDALLFILQELSDSHPGTMTLSLEAGVYRWRNFVTGDDIEFRFADDAALPEAPLTFAASQIVEDLFLLDEREGALHLDAIAATFTGAWSSSFNVGMSFSDIHGPVPRVHSIGLVDRTEKLLMSLGSGEIVRRLNWSMYDDVELDASLEKPGPASGRALPSLVETGDYGELRLRVEIQHLVKLPLTDTILFMINYHLAPLSQLARVPSWRAQLVSVLRELPEDMAVYKNFASVRRALIDWLQNQDNS